MIVIEFLNKISLSWLGKSKFSLGFCDNMVGIFLRYYSKTVIELRGKYSFCWWQRLLFIWRSSVDFLNFGVVSL